MNNIIQYKKFVGILIIASISLFGGRDELKTLTSQLISAVKTLSQVDSRNRAYDKLKVMESSKLEQHLKDIKREEESWEKASFPVKVGNVNTPRFFGGISLGLFGIGATFLMAQKWAERFTASSETLFGFLTQDKNCFFNVATLGCFVGAGYAISKGRHYWKQGANYKDVLKKRKIDLKARLNKI